MYMSAFLVLAVTLAPAAFGSQKSPDPAQATATQSCTSSEDDTAIYSAVLKEVISKTQSDKTQRMRQTIGLRGRGAARRYQTAQ